MPEVSRTHMGGTMRLGLRPTVFTEQSKDWSIVRKLYGGAPKIWERHRHRYEVNPAFVERLEGSGLHFSGKDEKSERMQVLELPGKFNVRQSLSPESSLIHKRRSSIFCRPPSAS